MAFGCEGCGQRHLELCFRYFGGERERERRKTRCCGVRLRSGATPSSSTISASIASRHLPKPDVFGLREHIDGDRLMIRGSYVVRGNPRRFHFHRFLLRSHPQFWMLLPNLWLGISLLSSVPAAPCHSLALSSYSSDRSGLD